VRGAIVDWFDFKKGSTIIEIGAGCGAITEALVSKPVKVSALELTDKRAVINATRNQKAKNLEMLIGNLQELPEEAKFDYAVCVGVLEYAGTFIEGDQPYHKFLELIRRHLKPGGTLLLAIENRLGIKYWAGAREDHTGHLFDGLNAYPNKAVQTFGRLELEILFSESGYRSSDFHYPFPDYKHPHMIYSDSYYPGNGAEFPLGMLPTPVPGQDRVELFSEALAMLSIESNQLFPYFSNSFIVVAENEK
jgi:cyclopropane fatty-acyl-phospholipid synthase-like methyltransferase